MTYQAPRVVAGLWGRMRLRAPGYPTDRAVWTCPRCGSPRYGDEHTWWHTDASGVTRVVCDGCVEALSQHYDGLFVRWSTTGHGRSWIARGG